MQKLRSEADQRDLDRVQLLRYAGPRQIILSVPRASHRAVRVARPRHSPRLLTRRRRR